MKKCEQCNITYDDSKKFCKKCGNALAGDHKLESKEAAKKQVFEDRLKIDPLNAGLLHEYAQFLFGIGLYKEAITVLLKILALDEKDETAMDLLFKSYQKLEMYKEAGETGKQLLEYRPGDTSLYESLILIFTSLDNSTEVLRLCDHVLDTEPDNTIGLYHKALILLKENDLPNAIGLFKQAYEAGQRGQLTVIYTGIHHVLEAEFEKAVELLLPVVVDIQKYAGNINLQRGSLYLALSLCKISAELPKIRQWVSKVDLNLLKRHHFPQDQKAVLDIILFIFTTSFESLPDSVDAKNEIDQLIKNYLGAGFFTPDHSSSISTLWYNIGTKQTEFALFSDSIKSFQHAVNLTPTEPKYAEALDGAKAALTHIQKKRKRKLIVTYASVLLGSFLIIASVILFNYIMENKKWEEAVEKNTIESISTYIAEYPQGRRSMEADSLLEEAYWHNTREINTILGYDEFINDYSRSKYA